MAHHQDASTHHGAEHAHPDNTKAIWKTFFILLAITIVELFVGMAIAPNQIAKNPNMRIWFNMFYLIMTLAKAFYIVAEFMHLRHEVKNLIMTIIFPLTLFVWFIGAFLWDGNSYKNLRNERNPQPKRESAALKAEKEHKAHSATTHNAAHNEHK
jgi:cytochrome c oxidase subunit IV